VTAHLAEILAGPKELVALGQLADDLIRRMPPALVRCHVVGDSSSPEHRATESHNDWTTTTGSPHRPSGFQAEFRLTRMSFSWLNQAKDHQLAALEQLARRFGPMDSASQLAV
jgi:hypothetical protein